MTRYPIRPTRFLIWENGGYQLGDTQKKSRGYPPSLAISSSTFEHPLTRSRSIPELETGKMANMLKIKFGPTLKVDQKRASQYEAGYTEISCPDMLAQESLIETLEGGGTPRSFQALGLALRKSKTG
ncbi:hypothetical protein ACN38_g632 [Penicillium nordicum]|uniref:Uncharacterized protein n=1 Tax=Penicillium nordicum TaxID=229535 RepID=A0A0M8PAF2_9EURO|nr:hypothetical protein ACN38_g632 [Penicillium nordicum]